MEIYTLDRYFLPLEFITQFTSIIWTERYSSAGDVEIVVSATPEMVEALTPGRFLGLKGTKEIMVLETHSIEKNLLTVKGSSLVTDLNNREAWFPNPAYDGSDTNVPLAAEYTTDTQAAGAFLADVLNRTVISPSAFSSYWLPINFDWANDAIAGLALGLVDGNGTVKRLSFPLGPLYDGIASLASNEHLGFKLYLESSQFSTHTYVLRFATYRGKNRTSDQTANFMVRLTPQMDSLNDVAELRSLANFKNVVYVNYKNQISTHYIGSTVPTGFDRRVLRVDAPDIYLDPTHVAAFREQVAYNAFVQHALIQAVDGQVSTQPGYKFQKDYYLGDVVELEGTTGLRSKAQVIEYIRTQDKSGVREYPTLAVIDPVLFDFESDLEPNPDFEIPWFDDPNVDFDFPDFPFDDPTFDDPIFDDPNEDPEHVVKKKKRKRKPSIPDTKDPNPDPDPDYTHHLGPTRIIVGFYPDQNNGEAVAKITTDGELGPLWVFETEGDPSDYNWEDLIPLGWTSDKTKVILWSDDDNNSDNDYEGYTYWLMNPDGTGRTRMTERIDTEYIIDSPPGVFPLAYHSLNSATAKLWVNGSGSRHWYVVRSQMAPLEYIYADGTLSDDITLHDRDPTTGLRTHPTIDDPGPIVGSGGPVEIYHNTDGVVANLDKILGVEDFPERMRWAPVYPQPSPDGSKVFLERGIVKPSGASFLIGGMMPPPLGVDTFRIIVGKIGSYFSGIYTSDIPVGADAAEVWSHVYIAGHDVWEFEYGADTAIIDDPRDHGYPYTPWYQTGGVSGGSPAHLPNQAQCIFQDMTEEGVWFEVEYAHPGSGYGISPMSGFWGSGKLHRYLCNPDGSDLTEIDFGDVDFNYFGGWSPDSTKFHGITNSASGQPYSRWWVYDIASNTYSYPLDYSSETSSYGYGPMFRPPIISPNGEKVVYTITHIDGSKELITGNIDGTDLILLYTLPGDADDTDQDLMFIGGQMSWSFDSTKICVVDNRDQAPVWIVNATTGAKEKVFAGTGWDNPDEQQWIYDPINFNG